MGKAATAAHGLKDAVRAVPGQAHWLRQQPAFIRNPLRTSLRLASWRTLTWLGRPGVVRLKAADVTMILPSEWKGMAKLAYAFADGAEPELTAVTGFIPAGTVAVDAGAHYGDYTLVLSRAVGQNGQVWAIDPCPEYLDVCRANVAFNHLDNVRFFELGLSDAPGRAHLVRPDDPSMAFVQRPASGAPLVELTALDDLLKFTDGRRISFVKLDIEGSEMAALRGAQRTISEHRPVMLVELQEQASRRAGHTTDDLLKAVTDLGYTSYVYDWRADSWCSVYAPVRDCPNHLFVPTEYGALTTFRFRRD